MKEITAKTGVKRTTLYRQLSPRSPSNRKGFSNNYCGGGLTGGKAMAAKPAVPATRPLEAGPPTDWPGSANS